MKKALMLFMSLILVVSLSACGSKEEATPANNSGEEQVELTFWNTWVEGSPEHQALTAQVEKFSESHPNIKINMEGIPHDQYKIKVKTQAAGRQLPDMIQVWPGAELEPFVEGGVLMPIDDIVDNWKDKLIPADQLTEYAVDGKQYAIPGNKVYTHVIFYDKDLLASVGYDEFPTTYEEFKTMITKLRDSGVTPIALGNKGQWVLQSSYISTIADRFTGSDFFEKVQSGEKKFTDPEFVQALNVIKELTELNAFNPDMNTIDNIQQRDYFLQGNAAMFIEGTWAYGDLETKLPEGKNVGIATFPAVEGGKGDPNKNSGTSGYGISLNSDLSAEKKEAAYEFLKFYYNEDLYKSLLAVNTLVPAQVELPEDASPLFKQEIEVTSGGISPVFDAVFSPELTDIMNNGLQAITLGDMTPEELAEDLQKSIEQLR